MDSKLWLYLAFVAAYRILELIYMKGRRSFLGRGPKDKTYFAIVIPFSLALTMPAIEYAKYRPELGLINMGLGIVLFTMAIVIRVKGLKDLGEAFSPFIEKRPDHQLVTSGIYAYVRHPLYLAVFLLVLGCSVFFRSPTGWLFVALTFGGIMGRTKAEERFLRANFPEYSEYQERTWRLLPYIL